MTSAQAIDTTEKGHCLFQQSVVTAMDLLGDLDVMANVPPEDEMTAKKLRVAGSIATVAPIGDRMMWTMVMVGTKQGHRSRRRQLCYSWEFLLLVLEWKEGRVEPEKGRKTTLEDSAVQVVLNLKASLSEKITQVHTKYMFIVRIDIGINALDFL